MMRGYTKRLVFALVTFAAAECLPPAWCWLRLKPAAPSCHGAGPMAAGVRRVAGAAREGYLRLRRAGCRWRGLSGSSRASTQWAQAGTARFDCRHGRQRT